MWENQYSHFSHIGCGGHHSTYIPYSYACPVCPKLSQTQGDFLCNQKSTSNFIRVTNPTIYSYVPNNFHGCSLYSIHDCGNGHGQGFLCPYPPNIQPVPSEESSKAFIPSNYFKDTSFPQAYGIPPGNILPNESENFDCCF